MATLLFGADCAELLARRGHQVTFSSRDVPYTPPTAICMSTVRLPIDSLLRMEEIEARPGEAVAAADSAIVTSYFRTLWRQQTSLDSLRRYVFSMISTPL